MKWVLLALSVIILVSGCTGTGPDAQNSVTQACLGYENDVCGLFECMVDMCWCDDFSPDGPVLLESGTDIKSEEAASLLVESYLTQNGKANTITSSRKLNSAFFNVFSEDISGNEEVFTVSSDGKIIKTVCGV